VSDDAEPIPVRPWPDPPAPAVIHGLAGAIVRAIEPESEADPLALLAQLLVAFGNAIGRAPYYMVESTLHHANEFLVLVGETATGRKGTAADRVRPLFLEADKVWADTRIASGLSSGEGLISAVRDARYEKQPIGEKGRVIGYQSVMVDEGIEDKRLLVLEPEFGGVLSALEREGNKLSALLRRSWDNGTPATLTKSPLRASGAHISVIGHITAQELLARLPHVEQVNGLANRVVWLCVRRSKSLPHGGGVINTTGLVRRLTDAVTFARGVGRMAMSPDARLLWESHYDRLTTPPPGVLGPATNRAAPHVLRLAMKYALLDRTAVISTDHLGAALALWDAAAQSARYIFGGALGNPRAEKILAAVRQAPGMTRTEIHNGVFNRNLTKAALAEALALLMEHRLIREQRDDTTGGAPAWRYYPHELNELTPPGGGNSSFNSFNSCPPSPATNGPDDYADEERRAIQEFEG
jgi:hypothetical protein